MEVRQLHNLEVVDSSSTPAATSEQEDKLKSDLMNTARATRYGGKFGNVAKMVYAED